MWSIYLWIRITQSMKNRPVREMRCYVRQYLLRFISALQSDWTTGKYFSISFAQIKHTNTIINGMQTTKSLRWCLSSAIKRTVRAVLSIHLLMTLNKNQLGPFDENKTYNWDWHINTDHSLISTCHRALYNQYLQYIASQILCKWCHINWVINVTIIITYTQTMVYWQWNKSLRVAELKN